MWQLGQSTVTIYYFISVTDSHVRSMWFPVGVPLTPTRYLELFLRHLASNQIYPCYHLAVVTLTFQNDVINHTTVWLVYTGIMRLWQWVLVDLTWRQDAVLLQGGPRDATVNFGRPTYRSLPRHRAVFCQVADVEARQRLRSSSSSSLIVSRTRLSTVGDRAFPVAAARIWNCLPDLVTVAVFRSWLKTNLFKISYPSTLWLYSACAVTLSCFGHYNRSCLLTYLLNGYDWHVWLCDVDARVVVSLALPLEVAQVAAAVAAYSQLLQLFLMLLPTTGWARKLGHHVSRFHNFVIY